MADYVFIDGKNLAYRVSWTHRHLAYQGTPTGLFFGFFTSLEKIMMKYPDRYVAIAWDGTPKRRIEASQQAVVAGMIPSAYKQNREERVPIPEMERAKAQIPDLVNALGFAGVKQGFLPEAEADDIIATWTKVATDKGRKVTIITSDKDFYQLLWDNVEVYDAMNDRTMNKTKLLSEFGLDAEQWVDVGAIAGDSGDNIFGVPGWGEKTAIKYLMQSYSWQKVFEAVKKLEKKSKKEEVLLQHEERVKLAYDLKKMDTELVGCPKLNDLTCNLEALRAFFTTWGINSLKNSVHHFDIHPRKVD